MKGWYPVNKEEVREQWEKELADLRRSGPYDHPLLHELQRREYFIQWSMRIKRLEKLLEDSL